MIDFLKRLFCRQEREKKRKFYCWWCGEEITEQESQTHCKLCPNCAERIAPC